MIIHELEDMNRTRSRAVALYGFLKEFTELRTKTVRSVDEYEHVLWFSDIPKERECDCAAWHRGEDGEHAEVWIAIPQPRLARPQTSSGPRTVAGPGADHRFVY